MIPILIAVGLGLIGYAIGKSQTAVFEKRSEKRSPGRVIEEIAESTRKKIGGGTFVGALDRYAEVDMDPPKALVDAAIVEAYERGDWDTVRAIKCLYMDSGNVVQEPVEKEVEKEVETESEVGETLRESPIEGIPDSDWEEFIGKLKTREVDFSTEKHVGQYEHNRKRLSSLGIEPPTTDEDQYNALVADLADQFTRGRKLINEFAGDVIDEMPITLSGILGLMKAGGVVGAERWLRDKEERTKFPRTKELFDRVNGIF